MIIETEPCANCDLAPCLCGRDIEDCMKSQGEMVIRILNNEISYQIIEIEEE